MPKKQESLSIPSPVTDGGQRRRRYRRFAHFSALTALVVVGLTYLNHVNNFHHPQDHIIAHWHPPPPLPTEEAEKLFLTVPNAESALAASRDYATHPHLAGSTEDFDDAKVILKLFQDEFGIPHHPDHEPIFKAGSRQSRHATLGLTSPFAPKHPTAWIDTYYPVLNTPLNRTLQILGDDNVKVLFDANLVEDGDPADPDAAKYKDSVPTWHGLSFDGEAVGELVYANYGTQEDYQELLSKGVDLLGKIVITRYGRIFRGLKIKGAQELGAAGVLIYSDPRDDGVVTVQNGFEPYPQGPARNPTSVQRGSVQYLSLYPGDPTTPGYPAYEHAPREDGVNIPKIPSLPISWQNARRLLKEIRYPEGTNYNDDEPQLTGRVSERKIKLVNHVDTKVTPIWNTLAAIPGHIKNEVVLIGCHRDAWVLGAADPVSGTVSLHEIIRGFGVLLRNGWRPLRTILIASWDGEEYGLVGSTEWGEDFPEWISSHVVAYLNVDVSVDGSQWNVGASPSLANLIKKTALDVPHPTKPGKTLWDARDDEGPFEKPSDANITQVIGDKLDAFINGYATEAALDTGVYPLGSGSDYTVFLQRLGIASTDQGFGSTATDAVYHYHSIYDSQRWQEVYGDPTFERHVAVAKHLGLLGLRLIDGIVLPLNTTQYSFELDTYLDKVEALASKTFSADEKPDFSALRSSIERLQQASLDLDEEKDEAERKFKEALENLPKPGGPHHHCDRRGWIPRPVKRFFRALVGRKHPSHGHPKREFWRALRMAKTPGEVLAIGLEANEDDFKPFPGPILKFIKAAKRVGRANHKLKSFERGFISEEGIKEREWYKHLGVAPGKWLGYGATTFPALTEAITIEKNVTQAQYEAQRLVDLLDDLAKRIKP